MAIQVILSIAGLVVLVCAGVLFARHELKKAQEVDQDDPEF